MRSSSDEIRKRIEKRKKQRERMARKSEPDKKDLRKNDSVKTDKKIPWIEDEERYGFDSMTSYESGPNEEDNHPLFSKEAFIFKFLASAVLVLLVAIMFRNDTPGLDPARSFVTKSLNEEFQFAAVSDWYEGTFGKPLALFPEKTEEKTELVDAPTYALPASGKILEEFGENGQRITIETGKGAMVEAMNGGLVLEIGEKEGFGQTVVIQHPDKSESWYGNLSSVDASLLYEYIEKGTVVGKATDYKDGTNSSFYFAIKEGENFVDPIQVIQFE